MCREISVIICTYNRKNILKKCLENVFCQEFPSTDYEVIVVVDGSTDGTGSMLQEFSSLSHFKVIWQENKGAAAARNRGGREASGDILLFLDDDIMAATGLLTEHLRCQNLGHSLVLGNIPLYPAKSADFMTEGTKWWAQNQFKKMAQKNYQLTFRDIYFANASISREVFFEMGGFDEQFRFYGLEDREFAYRLLKTGIKPVYSPQAVGYQLYDKDFHTYCHNYYWVGRGEVKLVKKYSELWLSTRLSGYYSTSSIRMIMRQASLRYPRSMGNIMTIMRHLMENVRKLHGKGAVLTRLQSFVRDYYYWLGVKEEIGSTKEFLSFVEKGSWVSN